MEHINVRDSIIVLIHCLPREFLVEDKNVSSLLASFAADNIATRNKLPFSRCRYQSKFTYCLMLVHVL